VAQGGVPCTLFRFASSWRSSRLRPWQLLQQIVFLFTQTAPETGLEGIATANADGSDVQQVTISPTFDY
jgi:hypothetical protein